MLKAIILILINMIVAVVGEYVIKKFLPDVLPLNQLSILAAVVIIAISFSVFFDQKRELVLTWPWHRFWLLSDLERKYKNILEAKLTGKSLESIKEFTDSSIINVKKEQETTSSDFIKIARSSLSKNSKRRLIILGEPGSGKSFALVLSAFAITKTAIHRLGIGISVPLYIRCDEYRGSLIKLIEDNLPYITRGKSGKILQTGVERLLRSGRVSIFLDALDEVPADQQDNIYVDLRNWIEAPAFSRIPILITGRVKDIDPLQFVMQWGFENYLVQKLDDDGVKKFIEIYKDENHDPIELFKELGQKDLLDSKGLGRNPFWLNLMIRENIFEVSESTILDKTVDRLLKSEWKKPKTKKGWNRVSPVDTQIAITRKLLSSLAYQLSADGKNVLDYDDARKFFNETLKIELYEDITGNDIIGFAEDAQILDNSASTIGGVRPPVRFRHTLLREFFAACEMFSQRSLTDLNVLQACLVDPPKWWNIIRLAGQLIAFNSPPDYKEYKASLKQLSLSDEPFYLIAMVCLLGRFEKFLDEDYFKNINTRLADLLEGELSESIIEAVKLGLDIAPEDLLDSLAAVYENEPNNPGLEHILGILIKDQIKYGYMTPLFFHIVNTYQLKEINSKILSEIGVDSVTPLLEVFDVEGIGAQDLAIDALGKIGDQRAIEPIARILEDTEPLYCHNIIDALGNIGGTESTLALAKFLKRLTKDSGEAALLRPKVYKTLAKMGESGLDVLLSEIEGLDPTEAFLANTPEVFFSIGSPAIDALIDKVQHPKEAVRYTALHTLSMTKNPEVLPYLAKGIKDREILLSEYTIEALGKFGEPAIPYLLETLGEVRFFDHFIFESLVNCGSGAIPYIILLIDQKKYKYTEIAYDALGRIGGKTALDYLCTSLLNARPDYIRVIQVATAIGISHDKSVIPIIFDYLHQAENLWETVAGAIALCGLGNDGAYEVMIEWLEEGFDLEDIVTDFQMRFLVVGGLFELREFRSIPHIQNFLKQLEGIDSKRISIKLEMKETVRHLIQSLSDLQRIQEEKVEKLDGIRTRE